ncbi:MAG TPA: dTDP-4-dehydrorhamnose reductase [Caulobacteraceae bacterium]
MNWAPRILQFGATGQLARELIARDRGKAVTALSREQVDLTDTRAVADAIADADVDLVVNAAAYTAVDRAESEEDLAFAVNAAAPGAMAQACARRKIPLIHLSTDYVFDGEKAGAWREDDPIGPLNAYGRTKAAGETAVAQSGARALVLRASWVFSPYGRNFVKTMLNAARTRDVLDVVDDQHGRPTAAGEIAEFIFAVAPALTSAIGDASAGVFHFAGEGATTWRGLADAIFERAPGPRPRIEPIATADYPTPARRPMNSVLDCEKLERVLGVRPRPWREGLAETLKQLGAETHA